MASWLATLGLCENHVVESGVDLLQFTCSGSILCFPNWIVMLGSKLWWLIWHSELQCENELDIYIMTLSLNLQLNFAVNRWSFIYIYTFFLIDQVTFVEALDQLMPGFDPEIAKLAQRILINPRKIDYHTGVFASKVKLRSTQAFLMMCNLPAWLYNYTSKYSCL